MSRLSSVVVGLVFASSAFGQVPGEVMSFYCDSSVGDKCVLIDPVPSGGFIVTDISSGNGGDIQLLEGAEIRLAVFLPAASPHTYRSGIVFSAGSTLTFTGLNNNVTISGYIPCPNPCQSAGVIPAVGSLGQAVLVLMLVVAATLVLRRREDTKLG